MKQIYTNGNYSRFGIVSDKFYYLMEAEKARMMAWLDGFDINSPIEKTDTFDSYDVFETKSSFTLSDEFLEYPYENEEEVDKCIYDEDGNDVTECDDNLIFQLSNLEQIPYMFVFMLLNFPDLRYKILEVRNKLGNMDLDYHSDTNSFTFLTIISDSDLLEVPCNRYEAALYKKAAMD